MSMPGAAAWAGRQAPTATLAPVAHPPAPASRLAFHAVLAFTAVMLLAPQTMVPGLAALRPALLAIAVAGGAYLLDRLLRREPIVRPARELWLSGALLWWAVLTMPLSLWVGGSVELLTSLYIKTLIVFWLLGHVVDTPARLKTVAWTLTVLAVPLAVTGIRQYLSGQFMEAGPGRIEGYEAALTNNPNDLALMLNMLLPLAVALLLTARTTTARLVLAGVVALEIAAIVLTFSRSGFVTLAVVGLMLGYRMVRTGHAGLAAAAAVALVLAVPLVPASYLDRLSTIVDTEADDTGSAQARWSDMGAAVSYISRHPVVGAGLGMDVLALNEERGERWTAVHDVYLQYGVDLGVPGMLLYVALLAATISSAAAARKASLAHDRPDVAALADAVRTSLVGFAVGAIFYPVAYHFYFYYFAGLAVAARHVSRHEPLPPLQVPRREFRTA